MKSLGFLFLLLITGMTPVYAQYNLVTTNPDFQTDISEWNFSGDVTATHISSGAQTPGAAQIVVNTSSGSINNAQMYSSTLAIPDSLRGKMLFFTVFARGADTLQIRIRIQVNHGSGGYAITKSSYLSLSPDFQKFSVPVNTIADDVSFKVILQHGAKTGTYVFDDISLVNADVDFEQISQFDNWTARSFRRPDSIVAQTLTTGTADISVTIKPGDTIAQVFPTQFGVNSNFRSKDGLVDRSHLYEEFGAFRFPAGSGSNIYFWDCNIPDEFAISVNAYCGTSSKFLDPDHFLQFRENAQGEPTIVVNYFYARYGVTSEGTREARVQQAADYAASWVHYFNIEKGADIKYWEIGNECYGSWETGYDVNGSIVTGKEYGEDLCVFADAMKAEDPSIRIGAVLSNNGFEWNNQVMREVEGYADYLVVHHYFTVHDANNAASALNTIQTDMKELQASAYMNTTKPKGFFPVCFTEFNLSGDETTNMMNGLFVADALATMVKSRFDMSTIWVNEWRRDGDETHGILSKDDPEQANYTARPSYTPYYYYGKCFGDHMVETELSLSDNEIKAYGSVFSTGEVGLVLLNYSGNSKTVSFAINDLSKVDSLFWYSVYADNMNLGNRKFYVNGLTSTTVAGGPEDLDDVYAFAAKYSDNSLFTLLPYSANYIVLKTKTVWTGFNSPDWSDPLNWSTQKPPEDMTNIVIPTSLQGNSYPEINSSQNAVCNDLTIENGAHLIIPAGNHLTVAGSLINNASANGLTLKANASGVASLLHNYNNVQATVESYLTQNKWHIVSAPVNNATSNVFYNVFLMYFNEPDYSWHFIESTDYDLTEGLGYFAWPDESLTGDTTVKYMGVLNNGDLTVDGLSYTTSQPEAQRGWNLIGNPYPSYINWNGNWAKTNVDATIYIYDGANYLTWNGTDGTHPNGDIAPGQGFWVKANDQNASVTIPQSERKHGTQQFYKADGPSERILITVEGNGYSDKMLIRFDDNATTGFDSEYDAWKFFGAEEAPQLFSIFGADGLTVDILPFEDENTVIPVGLKVGATTSYQLTFDDFDFENEIKIKIEDLKTGEMFDVSGGLTFQFTASVADDRHRFNLHFKNESFGIGDPHHHKNDIYAFGNRIYFNKPADFSGTITVFDMMGRKIYESHARGEGLMIIPLDGKRGYYIVKAHSAKYLKVQKVFVNRY